MKKVEIEKPNSLHTPGDCAKLNRLSDEVNKQRRYTDQYTMKINSLHRKVIILYTIVVIEAIIVLCQVFK